MSDHSPPPDLSSTGHLPPQALELIAAALIELDRLPPSGGTGCEHPGCCEQASATIHQLGCLRHVCQRHAQQQDDQQPEDPQP